MDVFDIRCNIIRVSWETKKERLRYRKKYPKKKNNLSPLVKYEHAFLSNTPDFLPLFNYFMIWLHYLFYYHFCNEICTKTVDIKSKQITKWFTILESQFIGNLELFGLKQILVSTLNIMGGILGGDIISERSKIWKYPAISYWLACITKNVILF